MSWVGLPKQARYQTAPRPEIFWVVLIFSCENRCFFGKTINCGLHVVVCAFSLLGVLFRMPESPMNTRFLREGIFRLENIVPFPNMIIYAHNFNIILDVYFIVNCKIGEWGRKGSL